MITKKVRGEKPVLNSTISGTIHDSQTGETVIGAHVVLEGTGKGGATNIDGEYTIRDVDPGDYELTASYLGYKTVTKEVSVGSDETLTVDFELTPSAFTMDEMVVSGMVDPIDGKKVLFLGRMHDGIPITEWGLAIDFPKKTGGTLTVLLNSNFVIREVLPEDVLHSVIALKPGATIQVPEVYQEVHLETVT